MGCEARRDICVEELIRAGVLALNDGYRVRNIELGPFGIPFVRGGDIGDGGINTDVTDRIRPEYAQRVQSKLSQPWDVAFITKGTVGRVGILRPNQPQSVFAPQVCYWRSLDHQRLEPRFLFYLLRSSAFQSNLDAVKTHGSMAADYVSLSDQRSFLITVPEIEQQRAIASMLGTLDDRIDLLRQTNTTLEAITQALFKSWFVDFDPVHAKADGREPEAMDAATAALFPSEFEESELGPIPKGWRSALSGTIYEVGIGKTPPRKEPRWFTNNAADVAWASIRDMGAAGVFLTSTSEFLTREAVEKFNVRMVPEGSVLMSFKLTVGRVAIADLDMTTNEAIAHFKPKQSSLPQSFLYCFLKSFDMHSLSSTSSIANATNSKAIRNIPILHPGLELAQRFDALTGPLFERIRMQQHQMLTLQSLRDTLLPRLISGKLRLPEAMEAAEAALA